MMKTRRWRLPSSFSSAQTPVSRVLIAISILAGVCLVVGCVAIVIAEELEDIVPELLVEAEVEIDTSTLLPREPTAEDWYPVAVQLLDEQGGRSPMKLYSLGGYTDSCVPSLSLNHFHAEFMAYEFRGILPYKRFAQLSFDQAAGSAFVWITEEGPVLTRSPLMDFSKVKVHSREVLDLAEQAGGEQYRQRVNNQCQISISLVRYKWKIYYWQHGQKDAPGLWIEVDARTGKITIR